MAPTWSSRTRSDPPAGVSRCTPYTLMVSPRTTTSATVAVRRCRRVRLSCGSSSFQLRLIGQGDSTAGPKYLCSVGWMAPG